MISYYHIMINIYKIINYIYTSLRILQNWSIIKNQWIIQYVALQLQLLGVFKLLSSITLLDLFFKIYRMSELEKSLAYYPQMSYFLVAWVVVREAGLLFSCWGALSQDVLGENVGVCARVGSQLFEQVLEQVLEQVSEYVLEGRVDEQQLQLLVSFGGEEDGLLQQLEGVVLLYLFTQLLGTEEFLSLKFKYPLVELSFAQVPEVQLGMLSEQPRGQQLELQLFCGYLNLYSSFGLLSPHPSMHRSNVDFLLVFPTGPSVSRGFFVGYSSPISLLKCTILFPVLFLFLGTLAFMVVVSPKKSSNQKASLTVLIIDYLTALFFGTGAGVGSGSVWRYGVQGVQVVDGVYEQQLQVSMGKQ